MYIHGLFHYVCCVESDSDPYCSNIINQVPFTLFQDSIGLQCMSKCLSTHKYTNTHSLHSAYTLEIVNQLYMVFQSNYIGVV